MNKPLENERKAAGTRKSAVVTGASSGIGLAISVMLCEQGYEVYGFGRNFNRCKEVQPEEDVTALCPRIEELPKTGFHPLEMDLLDTRKVCDVVKQIVKETKISVLVNAAGVGYYGLHEELSVAQIQALVRTNLELPLILANRMLRPLKEQHGTIINISSVTAKKSSPHGCAYAATKAGLTSFGESLFDEARKYGVKVCTIHPDMTRTNLYRNADFDCSGEEGSYLLPEEVAEAVRFILAQRDGLVVPEMTLRPQVHRLERNGQHRKSQS